MKTQKFGIEIELTGITRKRAAEVIGKYFNTSEAYEGGTYLSYTIQDNKNRKWKVMRDASVQPEMKVGKRIQSAEDDYKVEIVSPICIYEDIESIQEIIRLLREAGAFANSSCGIHIHIDAGNHNAKTLRNLSNIIASKEDIIYRALEVEYSRESRYCKKVGIKYLENINKYKPTTMDALKRIWYDPFGGDGSRVHYHSSRYFGLNLHSVFQKGTVEFRLFNSTTHAGKIKAYIQFCLAISHQALTQKSASCRKTESTNEKYTFRTWLLRLGLIGDEFKTARLHLLAKLEGDSAWRNAA